MNLDVDYLIDFFTKNSDPALKKKYAPFMRNDMHSFTSIWVFI